MTNRKNHLETLVDSRISDQDNEQETVNLQSLEEFLGQESSRLVSIQQETQLVKKTTEKPLRKKKYWADAECFFCGRRLDWGFMFSKLWTSEVTEIGITYKGKHFCWRCWEGKDACAPFPDVRQKFIVKMLDQSVEEAKKLALNTTNLLVKFQAREEALEKVWQIEKNELVKNQKVIEKNLEKALWRERRERQRESKKLEEQIAKLEANIEKGKEELAAKDLELLEQKEQQQQWEQEQEQLRKKASANAKLNSPREIHLQELVEEHRTKAQEWANKTDQAKQELSQLTGRSQELEAELASMTELAKQLKSAKEQLDGEYSDLLRRWELKGNLLVAAQGEIKALNGRVREAKIEFESLEQELADQKSDYQRQLETKQIELDTSEYEQKQQREEYEQEKQQWKDDMDKKLVEVYRAIDQNTNLETQAIDYRSTIDNLTQTNQSLQQAKEAAEQELTKARQKGRLTALGNVIQGAIDYVPGLPKAWKSLGKTSIQAGSAVLLFSDLPNWSYEAIIILFGLVSWYALTALYYRLFGRQEINKLAELRDELQEARSKVLMLVEEKKELVAQLEPKEVKFVNPIEPSELQPEETDPKKKEET